MPAAATARVFLIIGRSCPIGKFPNSTSYNILYNHLDKSSMSVARRVGKPAFDHKNLPASSRPDPSFTLSAIYDGVFLPRSHIREQMSQ